MNIIGMLRGSIYSKRSSLRCTISYPPLLHRSITPLLQSFFHGASLSRYSIKELMDLSKLVLDFSVP